MSGSSLNIGAIRGQAALASLDDARFAAAWRSVLEDVSVGDAQSIVRIHPQLVLTHAERWEPLIVTAGDHRRTSSGSLPLASSGTTLVVCGADDAQYHGWISSAAIANQFIGQALCRLWEMFPQGRFMFRHLPPDIPLGWCTRKNRVVLETQARPSVSAAPRVAETDGAGPPGQEPLELIELTTTAELTEHINQLATFADFKEGVFTGARPFHEDPLKRAFYLRLAKQPGVLYGTALRAGTEVVSAQLGTRSRNAVSLGVIAPSPSRPNSIENEHVRRLALSLRTAGLRCLGFPSGELHGHGDPGQGAEVTNTAEAFASELQYIAATFRRAIGARVGTQVAGVRERVRNLLRRLQIRSLIGSIRFRVYSQQELRTYRLPVDEHALETDGERLAVNCVEHLLLYEPAEPEDRPVSVFLSDCKRRLVSGDWVFTEIDNGRLIHHAWMGKRVGRVPTDLPGFFDFPPDSVTLWDDYTHPSARGRGLHKRSLRQRLKSAARLAHARTAYIFVFADNVASRKNIEGVGFVYFRSLFRRILLGSRRSYWAPES